MAGIPATTARAVCWFNPAAALERMLQLRRLSPASATSIAGRLRKSPAGRVIVVVSAVGGSGQVHQPVVGREQPPDQAQGDYHRGGGGGGEDQEHDDRLDQDGLQRGGASEDEPGP